MANNNFKCFTLIEIIVVVAILASLMAVTVPAILNHMNETDKIHAINEASSCVKATNYLSAKAYQADKKVTRIQSEDILKQAGVLGYISSYQYDKYDLIRLVYHCPNQLIIIYQNQEFRILKPGEVDQDSVEGMILNLGVIEHEKNLSQYNNDNVSGNSDPSKNGRTYHLQKNYLAEHGGKYPSLTNHEVKLLTKRKVDEESVRSLRWKPLYDNEGNIFLVADSKSSQSYDALAPLIYYKDAYYYHKSFFPQNATSSYIQEVTFSKEILNSKWAIAD